MIMSMYIYDNDGGCLSDKYLMIIKIVYVVYKVLRCMLYLTYIISYPIRHIKSTFIVIYLINSYFSVNIVSN